MLPTPLGFHVSRLGQSRRPIQNRHSCWLQHERHRKTLPRVGVHRRRSLTTHASVNYLSVGIAGAIGFATAYGIYTLARFITADADLTLLGLGRHDKKAFDGKVVWITGASQGLGECLAKYLSSHGAKLILSSRSREALEEVKSECKGSPDDVAILPFDMCGSPNELQAAASAAAKMFPRGVDFLVHNAGLGQAALATETSPEILNSMFAINTLAPIVLTQAILPHMFERKEGRIVCVCSMAGKIPSPGQAAYGGSKMGMYGYFTSLASEIAESGVGVTMCLPGPIATGIDKPRMVYGPNGLRRSAEASESELKNKLSVGRCTELVADAMAHGVDECWLSRHPVLLLAYLFTFFPSLGWLIMKKVGPKRAKALSAGKSGYSLDLASGPAP